MVRAVPRTRRNFTMPLIVFVMVLIAAFTAWKWAILPHSIIATVKIAQKGENSPIVHEPEKMSQSHQPQAVVPVSRLSFELSSVILPSTLHPVENFQDRTRTGLALVEDKNLSKIPDAPVKQEKIQTKEKAKAKNAKKKSRKQDLKQAQKIAKHGPEKTTTPDSKIADQTPGGEVPMKQISTAQKADAEFRKAAALMQQGRIADALAGFQAALRLDPGHDSARQALIALLLEGKRGMEAESVLQDRLKNKPDHIAFTMMLARLQVERGAVAEATETLEKALPYADTQADYQAFLAALLQRQNRHEEAITHYRIALQLSPNNGVWLMGYGLSLQAKQRNADAKEAFKRALDTQTLSPDLQAFVQTKIKEL
jgi:MSHA biogenesis protein MshN